MRFASTCTNLESQLRLATYDVCTLQTLYLNAIYQERPIARSYCALLDDYHWRIPTLSDKCRQQHKNPLPKMNRPSYTFGMAAGSSDCWSAYGAHTSAVFPPPIGAFRHQHMSSLSLLVPTTFLFFSFFLTRREANCSTNATRYTRAELRQKAMGRKRKKSFDC